MREYPTCRKGSDGCCLANRRVQEHRLDNKAKAASAPVRIKPSTPARRSWLNRTPTRLKIKPSGVARSRVNPPRVVMGEPQPGLKISMAASATRGAIEMVQPDATHPGLALGCRLRLNDGRWFHGRLLRAGRPQAYWLFSAASGRTRRSMVTVLPARFLGYLAMSTEQVPPQPYSRLPLATLWPPA